MKDSSQIATLVSRKSFRWIALAAALTIIAITAVAFFVYRQTAPTWTMIDQWIEWRYPDVEHIEPETLQAMIQNSNSSSNHLYLVDTRETAEFSISRISGAIHVPPYSIGRYAEKLKREIPLDANIVVYCSVGARSAEAAVALQSAGFTNVRNLRGSIFRWANEGRPLEGGAKVHPYDAHWGQLLDRRLHADL
jgi:rhodanese-related sulfurtransferase